MDVRFDIDGQGFCWNAAKAEANALKHGVRFEEARHAVIGFDLHARLLYVVHVEIEGGVLRLISARRATHTEENHYAE